LHFPKAGANFREGDTGEVRRIPLLLRHLGE
jgi:hypothetical protein